MTMMSTRPWTLWHLAIPALAVVLASGGSAVAADATGTWTWSTQRGDNTIEQTLKLKQEGETLTGTISGRQGAEIAIEDAKVDGDTITFKVTREFNGNRMVQSFKGKVEGDAIKGEVTFDRGGQSQSRPWEAKRSE